MPTDANSKVAPFHEKGSFQSVSALGVARVGARVLRAGQDRVLNARLTDLFTREPRYENEESRIPETAGTGACGQFQPQATGRVMENHGSSLPWVPRDLTQAVEKDVPWEVVYSALSTDV